MSDSNWSVRVAALGAAALLALTALGLGAFIGASHTPNYGYQSEEAGKRRAQSSQEAPSQIDRDRAGLPDIAERVASGPEPKNSDEREKRDLAAQESMSVWAFWMVVIAAFSTIITFIGTVFLAWQIVLTRQAVEDTGNATKAMERQNEIAEDSARRQLRAYISIGDIHIWEPDEGGDAHLAMVVRNNGVTPAHITSFFATLAWINKDGSEGERIRVPNPLSVSVPANQTWDFQMPIEQIFDMIDIREPQTLLISGVLTYRDCFDVERKTVFSRYIMDGDFFDRPVQILAQLTVKGDRAT